MKINLGKLVERVNEDWVDASPNEKTYVVWNNKVSNETCEKGLALVEGFKKYRKENGLV